MVTLGKYEILEEIGRGGFGVVYKARDTTLDRVVALKVLHPQLTIDPKFLQRFQQEARTAASFHHPHIVTIFEVGEEAGQHFLAMAYVSGWTLDQLLTTHPLPALAAVSILEQIGGALDVIHQKGFVHRDVKPSNIMVDESGQATLLDFGIVRAAEGTRLTTTMAVLGTPEYMSPELAEGEGPDARSDVYSLGVVAYQMFTGRAPFSAPSPLAVLRFQADKKPPSPRELNPDLSAGVEQVLLQALAKRREERFQSAGELARVLRGAVEAVVTTEPPSSAGPSVVVGTAEPEPTRILHPSLTLELSVNPRVVEPGGEAKWTATLRNDGDDDLHRISVMRDRTPIHEPFDLAVGQERRFAFTTTHITRGIAIRITAVGAASDGRIVSDEATAEVAMRKVAATAARALGASPKPLKDEAVPVHKTPVVEAKPEPRTERELRKGKSIPWSWIAGVGFVVAALIISVLMINRGGGGDEKPVPLLTTDISLLEGIGRTIVREQDGAMMVYVPGGTFQMGSREGDDDERPVRSVRLDSFWIDQTEVTSAQYYKCVDAGACEATAACDTGEPTYEDPAKADHPVACVNWDGATAYCEWVGGRLPTEAEWEYAARGPQGNTYPWGDDEPTCELAQFSECSGTTVPVGSLPDGASWCEALDMAGNVWEWVNDWYREGYFAVSLTSNPPGPETGDRKALRGGAWFNDAYHVRSAFRTMGVPGAADLYWGFRCAVAATP